jgi:hypothetical protein
LRNFSLTLARDRTKQNAEDLCALVYVASPSVISSLPHDLKHSLQYVDLFGMDTEHFLHVPDGFLLGLDILLIFAAHEVLQNFGLCV